MRIKKLFPFLFLSFLIIIIFFIAGVRYGKHIERLNTTFSETPQPSSDATKPEEKTEPITSFLLYQNTTCEVEFLYPDILTLNESSASATFTEKNQRKIELDCSPTASPSGTETKTILFQTEPIEATLIGEEPNVNYSFTITHPENEKDITITVHPAYLTLLGRTLQYELSD
jgi:hypothetical protein